MKIFKQFLIILIFSFLGLILENILPFKIPASVLGLILLFLALEFKIIKKSDIQETADFLKDNMAFLFVPLTVGLMNDWDILQTNLLNLIIIMIVTTTLSMIVVAKIAQRMDKA